MLIKPPELKGKLDTVTVNGPEDVPDWDAIDWRVHEGNVGRLRRRVFKATREQDWAQVRSLQKMMLRSWSNTLVSVRQVTQRNAGRGTPGVDGQVALSSKTRAEMVVRVHQTISTWDRCRSGACMYRRPMGNVARSVFRRRRHSAASSSDDLGFVLVTHPFHALSGLRPALSVNRCHVL
jgi:hypothetical protein